MKSAKGFFILIIIYFIILFFWERINQWPFFLQYNALMIRLRTIFLVLAGIGIMKLTLEKSSFKKFLIFYAVLWSLYYVCKTAAHFIGKFEVNGKLFDSYNSVQSYIEITQILTPFPFLLFWLANRVFSNLTFPNTTPGKVDVKD